MNKAKVKPCPFCGSFEITVHVEQEHGYPTEYQQKCRKCHAMGPVKLYGDLDDALSLWNKRRGERE